MRSNADWRPAQQGVSLYMPAPRVSVEETKQSMSQLIVTDKASSAAQSRISNVSKTIRPSCENEHIKTKPRDTSCPNISRDDSPDTLAGDIDAEILFDISPVARFTPDSSTCSDLLFQLMEAAESGITRANTPSVMASACPDTIPTNENSPEVCSDSERTDFQESPSPSVRKSKKATKCVTVATRRHFKRQSHANAAQPPVRHLNFGNRLKKQAANKTKRSANAMSLEHLRNIEREPSHNWDDDERELLCIINRWYCGPDRAAELDVFAKLFNSITELNVPPKRVRVQFENHLRLYGGEAYPMFARVFSVPFNDPDGQYNDIRALIETEAASLSLDLQRRHSDSTKPSGTAKFAKSPKTKDFYEYLVQKASHEAAWQADYMKMTLETSRSLATMSMAVRIPAGEDLEIIADAELSPAPRIESMEIAKPVSTKPHLTFRVWDESSRTKFINGRFVAQTFVDWPQPFPPPIALEDPSQAGKILTVLHLSKHGDTPVYISTTSSLLQAISYATCMQHPRIALISLDSSSLQEENKVHHAAEVFLWLKSQGLALWARYKGNGEYFVWKDIPDDAVLHTLDLTDLINNLKEDADSHNLLSFDEFEPGTKTNVIAAALREKNVTLNTTTARAMGKTARMFGMSQANVSLEHVQDFVARLLDGWTIKKPDTIDMHTMSSLAATFATALGSHAGGHTIQQVMGAFIEGADQGTRSMAHWSRRGSSSRRRRFRSA